MGVGIAGMAAFAIEPSNSWFEDQTVVGVNKERAHASYTPYATTAELQADAEFLKTPWIDSKSTLRKSLNGQWKFHYSPTPAQAPADFYEAGFNSSSWDAIPVPSCWQMQGYDTPMYINVDYPFDKSQYPRIVRRGSNQGYDENPVGCYLTEFSVPSSWNGKQLFLNFEGIYSAAYVWVNGQFVGYSQAANTFHEFDVTPYATQGVNKLAVKVIKWSDGSYLEDQDMMRWGGIFRDVTLTAVPKVFVRDFKITSDLAAGYTSATLNVNLELDNRSTAAANATAKVTILDTDRKTTLSTFDIPASGLAAGQTQTVSGSVQLSGLKGWTAETPNLYTVLISLKDGSGKETEALAVKHGFRKIEQVGRFIHINGKKVFFKGVNRQDTHPVTGRMQTVETLLHDVLLFKQFNINTVRTSHCPHQAKMMDMYDYFGIYVMDEADLETHAMNSTLVNNPDWSAAYVDREQRMVLRDRNHPSVIFWSMGNESSNGSNFVDCRAAIQELDDRMIHYEGQQNFASSDFTSKMYPYENEVINANNSSDQRPHFFCEYAHAMGQSLGNFVDYWDYIESSKRIIGGCIWDWADQAIYDPQQVLAGNYVKGDYRTGYDYPGPHQGNFMSNGVVGPEREVNAKLVEVKKVHQWIKMKNFSREAKSIDVNNTYDFIDLSGFKALWSVSRDGRDVENGTITGFNVESEATATLQIPYNTDITDDAEYLLTIKFVTGQATDWAEAGHVVAEEQFAINERPGLSEIDLSCLSASLETRGNGPVVISGDGFSYGFDASGNLISMNFGGQDYIYNGNGLKFDSYRWIENDAPYSGTPPSASLMVSAKVSGKGLACEFTEGDAKGAKAVTLAATFENPSYVKYTNYYTIYADGTLDVKTVYFNLGTASDDQKAIPRMGQSLSLDPALENLEYFARGPWSNYCDRKTASFAAVYNSTVTDEHESFIRPQSMGNHEELRYLKLTSPKDPDFGLLIQTEGQVSFSALHHTEADYGTVSHDHELTPRAEVILHLDYQQKGVGNGSCGSRIWSRYLVPNDGPLTNTIRFTPLTSKSSGYSVPSGNKGAYLTKLSADGVIDYSANSAPAELYTFLPEKLTLYTGKTITFNTATSATANVAAWIDYNHDGTFSDDEMLSDMTFSSAVDAQIGDYRMRIVVDSATPAANGPVTSGSVYDMTVSLTPGRGENFKYTTPRGTLHGQKKAYVKHIYSDNASENIDYVANACPSGVYTMLPQTIKAQAGKSFSLILEANEAGPRSAETVYQDLRYNYAGIFVDFNGTGNFEQVGFYGTTFSGGNILANYDDVMLIKENIEIPSYVTAGTARIRVIYQNAWQLLNSFNPNLQNIKEGVAYDINLEIEEAGLDNLDYTTLEGIVKSYEEPTGSMHSEGKAYVKHISSTGAARNIDVELSAPASFHTILDDKIIVTPGMEINMNYVANPAGPRSMDVVYQDLRYNQAYFFLGLPGDEEMSRIDVVGKSSNQINGILGNYDDIMDINLPVRIPEDAEYGTATLRVIYQNAWRGEPTYNHHGVLEGVSYDVLIKIADPSGIDDVSIGQKSDGEIYDLLGRRVTNQKLRPGVYIRNNQKILIK